jgi:hypothetical protein
MQKPGQYILTIIIVLALLAGILFLLTSESLAWRMGSLWADLRYALNPPEQIVFRPAQQGTASPPPGAEILATPTRRPPTATITMRPLTPEAPLPTVTPLPTATLAPTPLPPQAAISGVPHQFQQWNNCGPANLAMALSFWGWKGDQRAIAAEVKPNGRDKNVMPYELEAFAEQQAGLDAVVRVGGDADMLKAFVASGFPVIVEKGFEGVGFDGWMGHYQVVTGYDDAKGIFTAQDSYKGPDQRIAYEQMERDWRAFDYTYLVVYPPDRRQQVVDILGLNAYDNYNHRQAENMSTKDVSALDGRDLFFALFNQGANKVALQDYAAAAIAFDSAFANYAQLPEGQRPWRMMWYQTGPYFAYFYTGRYQDVINLATQTLDAMSEPILEETYYWRARALLATGDQEAAVADLEACLENHEGFTPCLEELAKLGITP